MGRPGEYSGALRGRCADLHSRCAQGTQGYYRTEALVTVSKGFSTEDRSARLYQQSMAALHCRGIKPARTSPAGSQICVHTGKRRIRDQGNHCRCLAWISFAGKCGTHRIRTSVCLRCCGEKLRAQSHCKRVERNLRPRRSSQEP